jgi:hypothetical protein
MNPFIRWAISAVLKWAYSLTSEDFAAAFSYVRQAQEKLQGSADKKKWVTEQLGAFLGARGTGRAINFLIELAVARLGASGK